MPHLVTTVPGATDVRADGAALLPDKTITGIRGYRKFWKGDITLVLRASGAEGQEGSGYRWSTGSDFGVRIVSTTGDLAQAISDLAPDVTFGVLEYAHRRFGDLPGRVVYNAEFPIRERLTSGLVGKPQLGHRLRITAGALRQGAIVRDMVRRSQGLQCNGWPAWDGYQRLSMNPLLYFDSRLTKEMIVKHAHVRSQLASNGVLRLGFSGRLIEPKGPRHAVELTNRLNRQGVPTTLTVFGGGQLRTELERLDEGHISWAGNISFADEWVRRVPHEIDLMVLPHIQGDPSGTYLESSGLGVPVLGFRNRAWDALNRRHGLGWAVPTGSVDALERQVIHLLQVADEVEETSLRGMEFMRQHDFENTFSRRVEHLAEISRR